MREFLIFAGPGRAGTTYVQHLFFENKFFVEQNQISLPKIKETYIFNELRITKKILNRFYSFHGKTYVDFSNLQYQNLNNVLSKSNSFNNINTVLFIREAKSWLTSLLIFELRKGKKISNKLIKKKLSEIDLDNYIDLNFLNKHKPTSMNLYFFDYNWIKTQNKEEITNLLSSLGLNCEQLEINNNRINESVVPRLSIIGVITKKVGILLRRFRLYKVLEKFKESQFIKSFFFKKTDAALMVKINNQISKYDKEIKRINLSNHKYFEYEN